MNVLDLFSGIGGFSLGLERAGMRTVAFCEIDPYCRAVLRRHWPDVPIYDDVRTLTAAQIMADANGRRQRRPLASDEIDRPAFQGNGAAFDDARTSGCTGIDVICGGFPCQDISVAGKGAGIGGERSGLWSEYARIIGEVRPRYVIVENVAALLGRGIERVLGDLAALGYDAEWHCIPASAVGAPHRRDRVWIVAHAVELSQRWSAGRREAIGGWSCHDAQGSGYHACDVAHAARDERAERAESGAERERAWQCGQPLDAADANQPRPQGWLGAELQQRAGEFAAGASGSHANAHSQSPQRLAIAWGECGHWLTEPDVGRVAHGVPARVDRLRALGNAVVPQIPELIGRAILNAQ